MKWALYIMLSFLSHKCLIRGIYANMQTHVWLCCYEHFAYLTAGAAHYAGEAQVYPVIGFNNGW